MKERKPFVLNEFLKREDIKEFTTYLVNVSWNSGNPVHQAILFMGFKTGAYCEIYNNSYEAPSPLPEVYSLEIIKELCPLR